MVVNFQLRDHSFHIFFFGPWMLISIKMVMDVLVESITCSQSS